jgi:PIN domain nuclease of toxin-antitoxin system
MNEDVFTPIGVNLINQNDLHYSPMVRLELEYLHEVGKLNPKPDVILNDLNKRIGLVKSDILLSDLVTHGMKETRTRDPFDRLIVSHAKEYQAILLTRDRKIQEHYRKAVW